MDISQSKCIEFIKNKPSIKGQLVMEEVFFDNLPNEDLTLMEYLNMLESHAKSVANYNNSTLLLSGGISNVRGSWLEVLMAVEYWNSFVSSNQTILVLKMPNVSTFNFRKLFDEEATSKINILEEKLSLNNVTLTTSNPDFLLIDTSKINFKFPTNKINNLRIDSVTNILEMYKNLEGKCSFDSIIGGISVKTSLRPDRRYQAVHEGNILKAIFIYLQQKSNVKDFKFKYYFLTPSKLTQPDKVALSTVATHTLVSSDGTPEKSVDLHFNPKLIKDLKTVYKDIIKNI
ncbi:Cfr10I/Bse634I family restriction endonuclease [Clostridium perfringens]|uniref:Cfr10I/Bse634I family restriction endonuclease n=1 Tax=Clostridium perfringens TaxID=1502 RepID=UPI001CCD3460|nr:Cfr10I/Bse634I family restriction endonuclease [Clostridium perfringens]UBK86161.1 Cfr10I/Bse634I family restriction endonuclease [Clostridium perfringens]